MDPSENNNPLQPTKKDKKKGQEFYAGGKASGVAIMGHDDEDSDAEQDGNVVNDILKMAEMMGKEMQVETATTASAGTSAFSGVGVRLGQSIGEPSNAQVCYIACHLLLLTILLK